MSEPTDEPLEAVTGDTDGSRIDADRQMQELSADIAAEPIRRDHYAKVGDSKPAATLAAVLEKVVAGPTRWHASAT